MKQFKYLHFLVLLVVSCRPNQENAEALFTLLTPSQTHVTFSNDLVEDEDFNMIEYLYFNNGAGVAAGDINNDGLIDLFFTSNQNGNKLYLNKGDLTFEDISLEAGISGEGNWATGVTMADVNGDGLLDIYVCHVGILPQVQYINSYVFVISSYNSEFLSCIDYFSSSNVCSFCNTSSSPSTT